MNRPMKRINKMPTLSKPFEGNILSFSPIYGPAFVPKCLFKECSQLGARTYQQQSAIRHTVWMKCFNCGKEKILTLYKSAF